MMTTHFYTKDWPKASNGKPTGRTPNAGERSYDFTFPLVDGNEIMVHCGDETLEKFRMFWEVWN